MVFQSYALYPHMTVAKHRSRNGRTSAEIERAVAAAAAKVGIDHLRCASPASYRAGSSRQRWRVPSCGALSVPARRATSTSTRSCGSRRVWSRIGCSAPGATTVVTTHEEEDDLADRIASSWTAASCSGTPREIYSAEHDSRRAFIGTPDDPHSGHRHGDAVTTALTLAAASATSAWRGNARRAPG
jgi:hypothetical protein